MHRFAALVSFSAMFELEVYAAGLRDLNKILELNYQLDALRSNTKTQPLNV